MSKVFNLQWLLKWIAASYSATCFEFFVEYVYGSSISSPSFLPINQASL